MGRNKPGFVYVLEGGEGGVYMYGRGGVWTRVTRESYSTCLVDATVVLQDR